MKDAIAVSRVFTGAKNLVRFSLIFLLALEVGVSARTALAQSSYTFCYLTVPNAGDPIQNPYSGQPQHTYWSLVIQGGDPANNFLAWARRQYGARWVKNPYSQQDGSIEKCMSPSTYQATQDLLSQYTAGYKTTGNVFYTMTNWPNVLKP